MKLPKNPNPCFPPKPKKLGKPIKPVDHSPHLDKMRLLLDEQTREKKELINHRLDLVFCGALTLKELNWKEEENA